MKLWSFSSRGKRQPASRDRDPEKIRIASPCSASWEEMKGNDWVRHCTECNLNVYNFSEMTWKEVERLIASHQGRLCARFYRRADGTVLTQDCPKGLQAVVRRVSRWAGAALSALTVFASTEARAQSGNAQHPLVQITGAESARESQHATVAVQVFDATGAVVPEATVRMENQVTQESFTATSDQVGRARFDLPVRSRYQVSVNAKGFRPYRNELNLNTNEPVELKSTLKAEPTQGLIVIESGSALVETENVPFQSNLQPLPDSQPADVHPVKSRGRKSPAASNAVEPGGAVSPSIVPQSGQPHAALNLNVTDPSGVMLPGAKVTLRDQNSNRQWRGVTDAKGSFSMPFLPLGDYMLTIEMAGLSTSPDIIEAHDPGRVNLRVRMQPGAMTGVVVLNSIRPSPIDVGSTVRTTFNLSDQ